MHPSNEQVAQARERVTARLPENDRREPYSAVVTGVMVDPADLRTILAALPGPTEPAKLPDDAELDALVEEHGRTLAKASVRLTADYPVLSDRIVEAKVFMQTAIQSLRTARVPVEEVDGER